MVIGIITAGRHDCGAVGDWCRLVARLIVRVEGATTELEKRKMMVAVRRHVARGRRKEEGRSWVHPGKRWGRRRARGGCRCVGGGHRSTTAVEGRRRRRWCGLQVEGDFAGGLEFCVRGREKEGYEKNIKGEREWAGLRPK